LLALRNAKYYSKATAALRFAKRLVSSHGRPGDADFNSVRSAGFTDAEIAEIVAHVALNIFTNYFNNTAQVEVDFPKIALRRGSTA
jgi:alkylhydroperoxidase family enzyme